MVGFRVIGCFGVGCFGVDLVIECFGVGYLDVVAILINTFNVYCLVDWVSKNIVSYVHLR